MTGSIEDTATSVEHYAGRFTSLLRAGVDPAQRVHRSEWTIAELGAHLASGALAYEDIATGGSSPYRDLSTRAVTNQQRLEAEAHRDLRSIADTIDDLVAEILPAVLAKPVGESFEWHEGIPMDARPFLGAMLGEFAFHGQDLARTVGVPWKIASDDAFPIVDFVHVVTPRILDSTTTRDVAATVELRLRGYDVATYAFDTSGLTVTSGRIGRPDVTMSVDAVAFLQVAYKRSTLTRPILTGKAVAWGRRPWLAFRFPGFFQSP